MGTFFQKKETMYIYTLFIIYAREEEGEKKKGVR